MQQQNTRCIRGELRPFFPENREECSKSDEKGSESNMKSSLWIKTLFRSPVRTIVTWVLLLAAAFQFTLSLTDYLSTRKGLEEAKDRMKGTLSLEHAPGLDPNAPGNNAETNLFLMYDPTGPGTGMEQYDNAQYHATPITGAELEAVEQSILPSLAEIEMRTMAAGVSDYMRLDDLGYDSIMYKERLVIEATIAAKDTETDDAFFSVFPGQGMSCDRAASCILTLEDIRVLGGDAEALPLDLAGGSEIFAIAVSEAYRDRAFIWGYYPAVFFNNRLYAEDMDGLEPGRRYVFVVRVDRSARDGDRPRLAFGDDTLIDWWPYFTDITDLPENYLEGEDFARLRELIQVTNDDWHTLDVVYAGDMSVIRRATDLRLTPVQGRFLEPGDRETPVCVVNEDFAAANGLSLGDTLRLKLGDYPMEQHVSLGAVASTRGRYADNWTEQEFTIIGTWRDVNQGNYLTEDYSWAYSDSTVFVPSSYTPEGAAKRTAYYPGDITLLIAADAMGDFVENMLPALQEAGWITYWNDRGWPQMEEELNQVSQTSLYKLLAFGAATLLVIALTVYLFVARRSRDYAILRAMGMDRRHSGRSLLIPLLCLTLAAVIPGVAAALLWYGRSGAVTLTPAISVLILPIVTMLAALVLVARMGRISPLLLIQTGVKK